MPRTWSVVPAAPAVAAGLALGVAFTLSPLTLPIVALSAVTLARASRDLPDDERWWFLRIFGAALALRLAAIAVLFLASARDSQGAGILFGDEAYALTRSWRLRNAWLGIPQLKYDYTTAFEGYGRSSYIWVMSFLQVLAGPAPYGLRVLNAALFTGAVLLMFRLTRRAFGPFVAFAGSIVLLFLPTLFFWSISLLKESFYFVLSVGVLAAVVELTATRNRLAQLLCTAVAVAGLLALRDLRNGAVALTAVGLVSGLAGAYVIAARLRIAVFAAVVAGCLAAVAVVPSLQRRAIAAVGEAATANAGHVFTVGHGYKLLDDEFYVRPIAKPEYDLTPAEAARYVARAAGTYLLLPLPWQIETRGELTYLPEQLFWYTMLLLAPAGAVAAFRRDRLVAALLIAYVLPTAAVVAMTTGNVGTLIRHRTLIVPYLVWISAMGFSVVMARLVSRQGAAA